MSLTVLEDDSSRKMQYRIIGMDCPSCAAKIEKSVRSAGVEDAAISTATQILTVGVADWEKTLPVMEQAVTAIG